MIDLTIVPDDLTKIPDLLKQVTAIRLAMEKEVEKVEKYETALENKLIDNLSVESPGVFGKNYMVVVKSKTIPKVEAADWPKFFGYVQQSGRFDLLQKRLSDKAIMDMLTAGEVIAGVTTMNKKSVSLTKIGS